MKVKALTTANLRRRTLLQDLFKDDDGIDVMDELNSTPIEGP